MPTNSSFHMYIDSDGVVAISARQQTTARPIPLPGARAKPLRVIGCRWSWRVGASVVSGCVTQNERPVPKF